MLVVRIIKSENCDNCKLYLPRLDAQGFEYISFDGDDSKVQGLLDEWKIDQFPVVQIINSDTNNVEYQFPPGKMVSPKVIDMVKSNLIKKGNL